MRSESLVKLLESKGVYSTDWQYDNEGRKPYAYLLYIVEKYEDEFNLNRSVSILMDYEHCGIAATGFGCWVAISGISDCDAQVLIDEGWHRVPYKIFDTFAHGGMGDKIYKEYLDELGNAPEYV